MNKILFFHSAIYNLILPPPPIERLDTAEMLYKFTQNAALITQVNLVEIINNQNNDVIICFSKDEDVGSNSDLSDVIDEPVAPREKAAGARRAAAAAAVSLLSLLFCCRRCCGSVGFLCFWAS
jgi:hypothetical protein